MKLSGRLVSTDEVTPAQRDRMFALMDRHYENVRREVFESDLDEKRWVIQVWHPRTGDLLGFSTQMLLEAEAAGRPITALFSGDTIIDRSHWGDAALMHVWGRLALRLIDERPRPGTELYWFLIAKGYKTYRFLPVFFHEFHPHPARATPDRARAVIEALARGKYPRDFDAERGVIRAAAGHDRLRSGVAELTPARRRDPFVRFFDERNPGHPRGDELCCLAPLTRANFTPAAYRVIDAEPAEAEALV
jgi:hypothetical protein